MFPGPTRERSIAGREKDEMIEVRARETDGATLVKRDPGVSTEVLLALMGTLKNSHPGHFSRCEAKMRCPLRFIFSRLGD